MGLPVDVDALAAGSGWDGEQSSKPLNPTGF